jgi:hypothetical protein
MGGLGSGSHLLRANRKTVVEDCLAIDANRWTREGILRAGIRQFGTWRWNYPTGNGFAIHYSVDTQDMTQPVLRLSYAWLWAGTQERDSVSCVIGLEATCPHLGGLRWWFHCSCHRRVGKLYLPPAARHFACRTCHRLTYTSCQESRMHDSLYRRLAKTTGTDFSSVKRRLHPGLSIDDFPALVP